MGRRKLVWKEKQKILSLPSQILGGSRKLILKTKGKFSTSEAWTFSFHKRCTKLRK